MMTRHVPSRWVFLALIGVLTLGLAGLVGFIIVNQADTIHSQQARISDLNKQTATLIEDLAASQDNAQRLYDQIIESGEHPVGEEPEDVVTSPAQGAPGVRGPVGESGRGPTSAEIAAAVAAYCAAGGCVGPVGGVGPSGSNGESIVGPPGAQGAPGEPGASGPAGPAGPAGVTCIDGFVMQPKWLSIADEQFGVFSRRLAAICVPAQ